MTDPYTAYLKAATDPDAHLNTCEPCAVGVGCPAGNEIAEREFRADRDWRRHRAEGDAR